MPHLFLYPTTYTGFLLFCFVTSEKWLYWSFMQGWRGLEASRVKRYRLGKDRKIGSFGQWIPIYQHLPSPLLILNHFLLIPLLLAVHSWQFRPTGLSGNWWTPSTGNRPMAILVPTPENTNTAEMWTHIHVLQRHSNPKCQCSRQNAPFTPRSWGLTAP